MLGDAQLATRMADALLAEGIYVIGFSYPVVPKGKARIRDADERRAHRGRRSTAPSPRSAGSDARSASSIE